MRWVLSLILLIAFAEAQNQDVPVVIKLQPGNRAQFMQTHMPRAVPTPEVAPNTRVPSEQVVPQINRAVPPVVSAQQPVVSAVGAPGTQTFSSRQPTVVAGPSVTIPPDVQNQLIKFFGLDSFGIPGLTGNHPQGLAGALQELRASGVPVAGVPQTKEGTKNDDVLAQANPNFTNQLDQLAQKAENPGPYRPAPSSQLPAETPGENGFIGLLSNSIRKLVKDTGVSDALSNSLPSLLGTGSTSESQRPSAAVASNDQEAVTHVKGENIRRKPSSSSSSPTQGVLSGLAAALGGGGKNSPTHAGLPRIPGIPLLPGGIPRNSEGQIDVVQLIGSVTKKISNGTTLADVLPPEQLQTLADNVTDALLPDVPNDFEFSKFMGRWFEGINSPRATEQRCVVHHYGGLTKNDKTATFTALKIYREGSEFGPVKYSIGYAFRGGNKNAMLTLHTSENSDTQPFWIYKLGPEGKDPFGNSQYEYAIVSNWVKYPVTVLVRDPDSFKTKYQKEVLIWLEKEGFVNGFIRAFNMLQPASYSSCQYADSTFEVFG
ncbi:unnamed protein product [Auanema sp. JU1783]|nr:unnamed protein product [Auanema sp. JU1783]